METRNKMIFSGESFGLNWPKDISSLKIREEAQDNLLICLGQNVQQWIEGLVANSPGEDVIGVLLGQVYQGENGACLVIDGALQAKYIQGGRNNFRFTHESWQDIHAMQEKLYPEKKVLGWFRVDDGTGFSTNDLVVQKLFFKHPWQVIYLLDLQQGQRGFFRWKDKEIIATSFFGLSLAGTVVEEKVTQPKVLLSQKRRKRISSRRMFLRRMLASTLLVCLVGGITFVMMQFWHSYSDLLSLTNLKIITQEGINALSLVCQNVVDVVTHR